MTNHVSELSNLYTYACVCIYIYTILQELDEWMGNWCAGGLTAGGNASALPDKHRQIERETNRGQTGNTMEGGRSRADSVTMTGVIGVCPQSQHFPIRVETSNYNTKSHLGQGTRRLSCH